MNRSRMPAIRKTTVEQGYGAAHAAERKRWQERLDQGDTVRCACQRADCPHHLTPGCLTVISSSSTWDLGHTDDRTGWTGPECVPCNRSAGARNSRASQSDPMTVRSWCEPMASLPR